ncbi:MAG: hypothetical protein ACFE0O_07030 [Opitutales bacterium]
MPSMLCKPSSPRKLQALRRYAPILIGFGLVCAPLSARSAAPALAPEDQAILPLSEIEPGMEAVWRTVVSGTEIETFPLRILGVATHFIGPRRSVIIAEALDDRNILTGPVAGMSGSPVYIDGKLIGAYAYGYTFAKKQALIGIQPIESMMEILETFPVDGGSTWQPMEKTAGTEARRPPARGWAMTAGPDLPDEVLGQLLQPLPTPLYAAGFSARTLAPFEDYLRERGITVMQAPLGQGTADLSADALKPGAPVAAVLMDGDFRIAGVGTVTWREGEQLLAFGHPFFQMGPTALPMAPAEVITVVQSIISSFKLSSVGEPVGAITQDRLTGIAGSIGDLPKRTTVTYGVTGPDGKPQSFRGHVFDHPQLTPFLASAGLLQSLQATLTAEEEESLAGTVTLNLAGHDPVVLHQHASGPGGGVRLVMETLNVLAGLMQNPFEAPFLESLESDFTVSRGWEMASLESVRLADRRPKGGDLLPVDLTVRDYQGAARRLTVEVPVPAGRARETLSLVVADAETADTLAGRSSRRGIIPAGADDLADIIRHLNDRHAANAVHVMLTRPAHGLAVEGAELPDLPASVLGLMDGPLVAEARDRLDRVVLWETTIPVDGVFQGSARIPVTVH